MSNNEELAPVNHDTSVMVGVIQGIDWHLLAKQKLALVELVHGRAVSHEQKQSLDGILHLLDAMTDAAYDDGLVNQTLEEFQRSDAAIVQQLENLPDDKIARLVVNAFARGYKGEDLGILAGVLSDQFPGHNISVFHDGDGNTAQSILMLERQCDLAIQQAELYLKAAAAMSTDQLDDWYEQRVGYRISQEDPSLIGKPEHGYAIAEMMCLHEHGEGVIYQALCGLKF